jgi:hypothetical protein
VRIAVAKAHSSLGGLRDKIVAKHAASNGSETLKVFNLAQLQ